MTGSVATLLFIAAFIAVVVLGLRRSLRQQAVIDGQIRDFGISRTEVEREGPILVGSGKNLTIDEMVKGKCHRYSMPRVRAGQEWELLQRDEKSGAQLPNGYLVKTSGDLPLILERLKPVAERFDEGVFEAEATKTEVAVYTDDLWRNAEELRALLQSLDF
jgi:hypothetical protein